MKLFLKQVMEQFDISVNQLSSLTGLSRTTITPLAKSAVVPEKTRLETLERISNSLNIPLRQLIAFDTTVQFIEHVELPNSNPITRLDKYFSEDKKILNGLLLMKVDGGKLLLSYRLVYRDGIHLELLGNKSFSMLQVLLKGSDSRVIESINDYNQHTDSTFNTISRNDLMVISKEVFGYKPIIQKIRSFGPVKRKNKAIYQIEDRSTVTFNLSGIGEYLFMFANDTFKEMSGPNPLVSIDENIPSLFKSLFPGSKSSKGEMIDGNE